MTLRTKMLQARKAVLLAILLAGGTAAFGAANPLTDTPAAWHARQGLYYQRAWGVDVVGVKPVSSGYMLRFEYRIVDPAKAKPLNDEHNRAYLIDQRSGARLAVPAMENVGELRQTGTPETDRTYFIIFGNPGRLVKKGERVSVVIGNFRVDNLIVE